MSEPTQPHLVRRGEGRPVVLVHGNGVDHRLLLPLDRAFEQAGGWERIYVDLPGFGQTPRLPEPGGIQELADWLAELIPVIVGDRDFALVGSSLGGLLARHLAARNPQQVLGMALLATVVDPAHNRRILPEPVVPISDDELLSSLDPDDRVEYEPMAVSQSPENWQRFRDHALPGIRAADPVAATRLAEAYELREVPEQPDSVFDRPVLIVTGRHDTVVGYRDHARLLDHYPHATYAVLDRAGHNVHLDQPDAVHALLRDWLRRLATDR
jgi:pimeloyl-ACP methyl ester carboxylesterase